MTRRMKLIIKLKLYSLLGKNRQKVNLIRKSGLFKEFGDGGYWHPDWIPSVPEIISIGNNVTVSADVRFYEHDVVHRIWNNDPAYKGEKIRQKEQEICVGDNCCIGARSIVLGGVHIGHNVVIGCGSVVTKDLPDYSIAAGIPAKIIGDTRELFFKRLNPGEDVSTLPYEAYFNQE